MFLNEVAERPLLGVAGRVTEAELELAGRFSSLHQLIYEKGGIRPTNAALEEVAKLIYLRVWEDVQPGRLIGGDSLMHLFAPGASGKKVKLAKAAFLQAVSSPDLGSRDVDGSVLSLWPEDEPFRLDDEDVLHAASQIIDSAVGRSQKMVGDPLGTAFDAFLSGRYDHSGGLGTYLTPSAVARAMVDISLAISDPTSAWGGEDFLAADPFVGTGRFLVALFEAIREGGAPSEQLAAVLDKGLVGADQSVSAIAKSALNLILCGARTPHVFRVADSIIDRRLLALENRLPMVLTNPPFGGGKYSSAEGVRLTAQAMPSLSRRSQTDPALAGLALSVRLLAPGGVLGIVLPEGITDGRWVGELASTLQRESGRALSIEANISLPTATFSLSGTVAKTSALFLRKAPQRRSTVLARVEHVGFMRQAGKGVLDPSGSDLEKVVDSLKASIAQDGSVGAVEVSSENPLVARVDSAGLQSLNPGRLDPRAIEGRSRVLARGGMSFGEILSTKKGQRAKSTLGLPFVSVLHVDDLGTVAWHEANDYRPVTPGQLVHAGDVIVSLLNPSKLRAAVIPEDVPEAHCSMEFGIFKSKVDAYAILGLLYSPDVQAQLRPLGTGTSSSRRRISASDVLDLVVPRLSASQLNSAGRKAKRLVVAVENQRLALRQLHNSIL